VLLQNDGFRASLLGHMFDLLLKSGMHSEFIVSTSTRRPRDKTIYQSLALFQHVDSGPLFACWAARRWLQWKLEVCCWCLIRHRSTQPPSWFWPLIRRR